MLVLGPEDVLVRAGESAHFYCEVRGDPTPAVEWSREQGPLPNGRYAPTPHTHTHHTHTHTTHSLEWFVIGKTS